MDRAQTLIGCLKEKWPESEAAGQDFSLWEPEGEHLKKGGSERCI